NGHIVPGQTRSRTGTEAPVSGVTRAHHQPAVAVGGLVAGHLEHLDLVHPFRVPVERSTGAVAAYTESVLRPRAGPADLKGPQRSTREPQHRRRVVFVGHRLVITLSDKRGCDTYHLLHLPGEQLQQIDCMRADVAQRPPASDLTVKTPGEGPLRSRSVVGQE